MNTYDQILRAVVVELAEHRFEIEKSEINPASDLCWIALKVVLSNGEQTPIKVYYQSESVRVIKERI